MVIRKTLLTLLFGIITLIIMLGCPNRMLNIYFINDENSVKQKYFKFPGNHADLCISGIGYGSIADGNKYYIKLSINIDKQPPGVNVEFNAEEVKVEFKGFPMILDSHKIYNNRASNADMAASLLYSIELNKVNASGAFNSFCKHGDILINVNNAIKIEGEFIIIESICATDPKLHGE